MEDKIKLTVEQVQSLWAKNGDDTVHTFSNPNGGMLLGFDRNSDSLLEILKEADDIQIGGDACMGMGHGIAVTPKGAKYMSELLFIQHNEEKMTEFLAKQTK